MPEFTTKHKVKLFEDEERTAEQSVTIDTDEKWVNIIHAGEELSMSLDNWSRLKTLVERCETFINDLKK